MHHVAFQKSFVVILLLMLGLWACSSDEQATAPGSEDHSADSDTSDTTLPELTTAEVTNITTTKAQGGGKVVDEGSSPVIERGICWSSENNPTIEESCAEASSVQGSGDFSAALSGLEDNTTYYVRSYGTSNSGTGYGDEKNFTTQSAELPSVESNTDYAAGTKIAFVAGEVTSEGGYPVTEKGICWSPQPDPDITDATTNEGEGTGSFLSRIEDLEPETTYYMRSYATNEKGTGYGRQVEVRTIARGNIMYTLHRESDPSEQLQEHYDRIEQAFEEAVYYYENFTSINKNLDVHYNPDVPTADGHINGTIRIGSNPSYQQTGTAMHEIMHTVGVGQSVVWNDLISNGEYQGEHANSILRVMTGDTTALIHGDNLHFWPYGINGAHEDTGEETLYVIHALIMQGMKRDGLPSN